MLARVMHQTMPPPNDEINIRVIVVAAGLFLFFAFLLALGAWVLLPTLSLAQLVSGVLVVFAFQCLMGFLGHSVLQVREHNWRRRMSSQWQSDFAIFMEKQEEQMTTITVHCPTCEQRTVPIVNSDDRFRCDYCDEDFQDQHHGIIDIVEYEKRNPDTSEGPYPLSP